MYVQFNFRQSNYCVSMSIVVRAFALLDSGILGSITRWGLNFIYFSVKQGSTGKIILKIMIILSFFIAFKVAQFPNKTRLPMNNPTSTIHKIFHIHAY